MTLRNKYCERPNSEPLSFKNWRSYLYVGLRPVICAMNGVSFWKRFGRAVVLLSAYKYVPIICCSSLIP